MKLVIDIPEEIINGVNKAEGKEKYNIPLWLCYSIANGTLYEEKQTNTAEWILCKDRLPEEYLTVMVTVKEKNDYYFYPEARYSKDDGWEWAYESGADYWTDFGDNEVIAWHEYPEPYKAE